MFTSFYTSTSEINPEKITLLRQHFQERSAKDSLYQSYLRDLDTLDQIRKKKAVSLQDATAKSETETIKRIEKEWFKEPDSTKELTRDEVLNQSVSVVADLAEIEARHPKLKTLPLSH